MKIFKCVEGIVIEDESGTLYLASPSTAPPPPVVPPVDWDVWTNRDDLYDFLLAATGVLPAISTQEFAAMRVLAPIGSQEVWCAGVTYHNSMMERMKESDGGEDFYERVYSADRPEIFFKALAQRVSGHGEPIHVRRDSTWDVPEPELAIFMTSSSKIVGYTMGNDVSSRSIEGENPLCVWLSVPPALCIAATTL
jgi:2-dehydro-3-deoxy-D-arabinonate dehydratase